jgi:hypothetical protein
MFPLVSLGTPFSELFFRQPPIADHASLQILIGHTQFVVLKIAMGSAQNSNGGQPLAATGADLTH